MAVFHIDTSKNREGSKEFSDQVATIEESINNIRDALLDLKTVSSGDDFDKYLRVVAQDKEFEPYEDMISVLKKFADAFSSIEEDAKAAMNDNRMN
jgi:hypothetical protein